MKYGVAVIGLGKISDVHITGWKRLEEAEVRVLVTWIVLEPKVAEICRNEVIPHLRHSLECMGRCWL
ncbi:MAG: hypothetical protein OK474_03980 [Thaumarchaeota archaeon]|nr:hypothetical protein [Nitrososphaerota archaeon]